MVMFSVNTTLVRSIVLILTKKLLVELLAGIIEGFQLLLLLHMLESEPIQLEFMTLPSSVLNVKERITSVTISLLVNMARLLFLELLDLLRINGKPSRNYIIILSSCQVGVRRAVSVPKMAYSHRLKSAKEIESVFLYRASACMRDTYCNKAEMVAFPSEIWYNICTYCINCNDRWSLKKFRPDITAT